MCNASPSQKEMNNPCEVNQYSKTPKPYPLDLVSIGLRLVRLSLQVSISVSVSLPRFQSRSRSRPNHIPRSRLGLQSRSDVFKSQSHSQSLKCWSRRLLLWVTNCDDICVPFLQRQFPGIGTKFIVMFNLPLQFYGGPPVQGHRSINNISFAAN